MCVGSGMERLLTSVNTPNCFRQQKNLGFWSRRAVRYFNPVGAHPSGLIGEHPQGIPNNLLPYVIRVLQGRLPHVRIFGNDYDTVDGTGVRDYIHVCDLANGHVAALRKLNEKPGCVAYNLGSGVGYSVMQIVQAMERVTKQKIPYMVRRRMFVLMKLSITYIPKDCG